MKILPFNLLTLFCICLVISGVHADGGRIGLITGASTGTYIRIGNDIAALAAKEGVNLDICESTGSLENIAAVFEREEIQLGLVQSDVLGYLQESQNRKLERVAQQIAMMFPLYNEEVHLRAKKEIKSIADLDHRVIAVGDKGSGTNLTSELLLEITNVWPRKKYLLKDNDALKMLNDGIIDALFYVSGYPVQLLKNVDGENFHLVPLNENSITDYYIDSKIPDGVYSWQQGPVKTVAVKAVLMTAGFHDNHCQNINDLVRVVRNNISYLKEFGHSKWKEVELDFIFDNWGQSRCLDKSIGVVK